MNNKTILIASLILTILLGAADVSLATVGGPTLIYDLRYDAASNSVYYTEQDGGGKGCPPELKAISLASGETRTIYSCDDGLKEFNYGAGQQAKIDAFVSSFTILQPLNLNRNAISIAPTITRTETVSPDSSLLMWTELETSIFQNGEKKGSVALTTCDAEDPIIVDGYAIPNQTNKILFLFSRKNDCFEGGYIGETLSLLPNTMVLDNSTVDGRKFNEPLVPHAGSIVAYAGQTAPEPATSAPAPTPTTTPSPAPAIQTPIIVGSSVLTFLIGLFLGRWIQSKPEQI